MADRLTMVEFLRVVDAHSTSTREALLAKGYHPAVITAKAEKASRKGYTDYGVAPDRPWLTVAGRKFLDDREGHDV